MDKNDTVLLIGLLLQKLGGEVEITKEEMLNFMTGLTTKELLSKEDPKSGSMFIKLAEKEKQTN